MPKNMKILLKTLLSFIFVISLYNTSNYFDVKNRLMNVYDFKLGGTVVYCKEIKNSLASGDITKSSNLLIKLSQSLNSQVSLNKAFNTNLKSRLSIPTADIMCYSDAVEIITYKIINNEYTEEDINILKKICDDFSLLENIIKDRNILDNNYLNVNEYIKIRTNFKIFKDLNIKDYIIKNNYVFRIK